MGRCRKGNPFAATLHLTFGTKVIKQEINRGARPGRWQIVWCNVLFIAHTKAENQDVQRSSLFVQRHFWNCTVEIVELSNTSVHFTPYASPPRMHFDVHQSGFSLKPPPDTCQNPYLPSRPSGNQGQVQTDPDGPGLLTQRSKTSVRKTSFSFFNVVLQASKTPLSH